jgi:mannose-binding lectin 2
LYQRGGGGGGSSADSSNKKDKTKNNKNKNNKNKENAKSGSSMEKEQRGGSWTWFLMKFVLFGLALTGGYVGFTVYRARQRDRF